MKHAVPEEPVTKTQSQLARIIKLRPDVQWSRLANTTDAMWVARDPVSLEYFHFSHLEKQIAQLFDGRRNVGAVMQLTSHPGITPVWMEQLTQRLEQACLLTPSQVSVAGRRLWNMFSLRQRALQRQRFLNPLAIRIKLFDPTQLLHGLSLPAQWIFSPLFFAGWLMVAVLVLYLVLVRWLQAPLELGLQSLTASQAIYMVVLYIAIKSLHELGHALACRRWQAECHEIGLMFLVFTPCLYCDTTDSWKLTSRWSRAGIAAAGIYVELMIATLASILWLLASSGSTLHIIAGNTMLICSLSTILVNGNPLLRYDGYYVLSDLWQVPNLHEQSTEALRAVTDSWLLDEPLRRDRWDANPNQLAMFALCSWFYRQFVVLMIAWLLWSICANSGIELLGILAVTLILGSAAMANVRQWQRWLVHLAGRRKRMRWLRVLPLIALFGGMGWFSLAVPLPTYAPSRVVATRSSLIPIYARQSGLLEQLVPAGQTVQQGEVIARIAASELEMSLLETRGQLDVLETKAAQLRMRLVDEEQLVAELATVVEQQHEIRERLAILQVEAADLIYTAPCDGSVVSTERQPLNTLAEPVGTQPPRHLLSIQQQNRLVERGTLLGWLSPTAAIEVNAYVPESTAELLRPEMSVRCRWDCRPASLVRGVVRRIATEPISQLPETLVGDPDIAVLPGPSGTMLPAQPHYEVAVDLYELPDQLSHQSTGTLHFETAPRTLLESIKRIVDQQLRPQL